MALQKTGLLSTQVSNHILTAGKVVPSTPFKAYITGVNDAEKTATVRIARYSAILKSLDINDRLPIMGLDIDLTIRYGDKIWVEVFYDKNLTPVFGVLKTGNKWDAQVVNPETTSGQTIKVYPKEHEFITKKDITRKLSDVDSTLSVINSYRDESLAIFAYRNNTGQISDAQYDDYVDAVNANYQLIKTSITEYKKNLNQFFSAAPTATWKKLFRTFTLICYTTHDNNLDLDASTISPTPQPETPSDVPQASQQNVFRLVQCLYSDLYLADMCYDNRYPARIPIAYHRPIYYFVEDGKVEDESNTSD